MADRSPEILAQRLSQAQIPANELQIEQLSRYCELLWQWNEKLNLTRHTDYERFVNRDVWDTWQLARLLASGEEILDLGSGGGVPGIPLAILRPDLQIALCESIGKKARALEDMVARLELPLAVHASRAEDVLEDLRFDTVVARAVGPLWKICHWLRPHWASVGRALIIKGPRWPEERNEARHRGYMHELDLRKLVEYPMAGSENMSVILQLTFRRPLA